MTEADVRKGMPPVELSREEFEHRYKSQFIDPAFAPLARGPQPYSSPMPYSR